MRSLAVCWSSTLTQPEVRRPLDPVPSELQMQRSLRALGQALERVPVRPEHGVKDLPDENARLVEQVGHRVNEDEPRSAPGDEPRLLGRGAPDGESVAVLGVESAHVLKGGGGERRGQREDDAVVLAVEQFVAALRDPGGAGRAMALGAVAVTVGAVALAPVAAAAALLHLAAESGPEAALDDGHDAPQQGGQGAAGALAEGRPVAPEDVRDVEPEASHRSVCRGGSYKKVV